MAGNKRRRVYSRYRWGPKGVRVKGVGEVEIQSFLPPIGGG